MYAIRSYYVCEKYSLPLQSMCLSAHRRFPFGSEDLMQRKFGGSLPVYVQFEGDIQEPDVLKMMMKTKEFMKEDPNITSAQSVADLVAQMNDAMGEGNSVITSYSIHYTKLYDGSLL